MLERWASAVESRRWPRPHVKPPSGSSSENPIDHEGTFPLPEATTRPLHDTPALGLRACEGIGGCSLRLQKATRSTRHRHGRGRRPRSRCRTRRHPQPPARGHKGAAYIQFRIIDGTREHEDTWVGGSRGRRRAFRSAQAWSRSGPATSAARRREAHGTAGVGTAEDPEPSHGCAETRRGGQRVRSIVRVPISAKEAEAETRLRLRRRILIRRFRRAAD